MKKDLLKMLDLSTEDIYSIIDLGCELKKDLKEKNAKPTLSGKTLAMIFEKPSTRTRVSFEVGMFQLGGQAIFLNMTDIQMGRGEPVSDTAKVLSRFCDGIMIRTFKQELVEELAEHATVPVINGLTDSSHPCQILADLMTIKEHKGKLEGLKVCYIGDGNNVANSLIVGSLKCGMKMSIACPKGYEPSNRVLEFAKDFGNDFLLTDDIPKAAKNADVVVTDVWTSMGQERELYKRENIFKSFQINSELLKNAKSDVMVQHCLPAHREEEITAEVFEAHQHEIFDEAENRLHAQKALLSILMR